jgi:hypothetical protein
MRSCCLCIPHHQLPNISTSLYETWYVNNGPWVHLNGVLHKSLPSVCVYNFIFARQRFGKKCYLGNKYTNKNRRIVWRVVLYMDRDVSKESGRLDPLLLFKMTLSWTKMPKMSVACIINAEVLPKCLQLSSDTQPHIPEERNFNTHCPKDLKSHI